MKIYATETRVVMDRADLEMLFARDTRMRALVLDLRRRQLAANDLLQVALHELAATAGASDRAYFARRWVQEHRESEGGWFTLPA